MLVSVLPINTPTNQQLVAWNCHIWIHIELVIGVGTLASIVGVLKWNNFSLFTIDYLFWCFVGGTFKTKKDPSHKSVESYTQEGWWLMCKTHCFFGGSVDGKPIFSSERNFSSYSWFLVNFSIMSNDTLWVDVILIYPEKSKHAQEKI